MRRVLAQVKVQNIKEQMSDDKDKLAEAVLMKTGLDDLTDDNALEMVACTDTEFTVDAEVQELNDLYAGQKEALETNKIVYKNRFIMVPLLPVKPPPAPATAEASTGADAAAVQTADAGTGDDSVTASYTEIGTGTDPATGGTLQKPYGVVALKTNINVKPGRQISGTSKMLQAIMRAMGRVKETDDRIAAEFLDDLEAGDEGGGAALKKSIKKMKSNFDDRDALEDALTHRSRYKRPKDLKRTPGHYVSPYHQAKKIKSHKIMRRAYQAAKVKLQAYLHKSKLRQTLQEIKRYSVPPRTVVTVMVALLLCLDDAADLAVWIGDEMIRIPKDVRSLWRVARKKIELSIRNPKYIVKRMKELKMLSEDEIDEPARQRFKAASTLLQDISYKTAKKGSLGAAIIWKWVLVVTAITVQEDIENEDETAGMVDEHLSHK
eukprot:CAMPEP_0197845304 /NCGR_PEP_ID=MMETSP1438-20131217/2253_1 /TAXON_ID=1461541 /ORGANISM="Pterosperma sp., Strain CCMP1384" /LENGTH=434 /DNA_ID=CAMNT_0043456543 /DNA_START=1 /DNA_END=1305 /DNA_ORIENTATION=+